MRIVFMGTPDFAVPSLQELARTHEVSLVLTRPDAIRGRGRRLEPSPVKVEATRLDLPVIEATRISRDVFEAVRTACPDAVCVVAFGAILPDELLALPPLGCLNVHGSLLPRWRGAAPIQRAILSGDTCVGISIMRIAHELDAGAYCTQASVKLGERSCVEVMGELARLGARELVDTLGRLEDGDIRWIEQDEAKASYAAKIGKSEMLLRPNEGALANRRRVQASLDAAPARCRVGGRGVRVLDARVSDEDVRAGIVQSAKGHVLLGCAEGSLELLSVKPDGKREMKAAAWASGLRGELSWDAG